MALRTLVLTVSYPSRASYYQDWQQAFEAHPAFAAETVNIFRTGARRRVRRIIGDYDLVVLLHSCTADSLLYIEPLAAALQARRGRLLSFVGNEVNLPSSPMAPKIAFLASVRPDFVATQLPLEAGAFLYEECAEAVIAVPHALNPEAFRPTRALDDRAIDIGARSYRYLAMLGDDDRNRIFDYFQANAGALGLAVDMSTDHRFDGGGWADFLNRCKATIATEAGSWYIERDDATVNAIRAYLAGGRRGITLSADTGLKRLAHRLPYPVKAVLRQLLRQGPIRYEGVADERVAFDEIYERFFRDKPRCPAYGKCISSRHFDAIGTKTLQIMFPGRFNDILEADRHYLALAPDFSNAAEVVEKLCDLAFRRRMVDEAYDHVHAHHTYARRLDALVATIERKAP